MDGEVFVYQLSDGIIRKYKGILKESSYIYKYYFQAPNKRMLIFKDPGIINNKALWLKEEDDDKAYELFIKSEEELIEELMARLDKHNIIVNNLKNRL